MSQTAFRIATALLRSANSLAQSWGANPSPQLLDIARRAAAPLVTEKVPSPFRPRRS